MVVVDPLERLKSALAGRYDIERKLGSGGMATVYLARDRSRRRLVAMKVMRPELAAGIGEARFHREIEIAAGLTHPHILPVFTSGSADGVLYYVMPYIEDESLQERLARERQLPLEAAISIAREAADGLAYAHSRGVVHRDIKPGNILLPGGRAVIADFGIARAVAESSGTKLTETGSPIGTPNYMAPEQLSADQEADGRADIYALGCVLYEMLAGRPPLTGTTLRETIARRLTEDAPPIRHVRPNVSPELEAAILRTVSRIPADRFQSAGEFRDALRRFEAGGEVRLRARVRFLDPTVGWPVALAGLSGALVLFLTGLDARLPFPIFPLAVAALAGLAFLSAYRGARDGRRMRRWQVRLLTGIGVAALALGAGSVSRVGPGGAPGEPVPPAPDPGFPPDRVAVLYFDDLSEDRSLGHIAAGLTESLIDELSAAAALTVISPNGVRPFRDADVAADSVGRALRVGTLVHGSVAEAGDDLRINLRLVETATNRQLQQASLRQARSEILVLQDSLTSEVADQLRRQLGEEVRLRDLRSRAADNRAWELLQLADETAAAAEPLVAGGDLAAGGRAYAEADSLLRETAAVDPDWVAAPTMRGWLAYQQSRWLASQDRERASGLVEAAASHAERALAIDPASPDALELRGTIRYWSWLLNLYPDRAAELFDEAESDLRAAVEANPRQAGAYATLSHLVTNKPESTSEAHLMARRAYEADAYLSNADVVLSRLFFASYDLDDHFEARRWCEEGYRRFPEDWRFADCRLWLLTMHPAEPDVDRAWQLLEEYERLVPPQQAVLRGRGRMAMSAVAARAGLADSAVAIAERARVDSDVDPTRDLSYMEAFTRTLLGQSDEAVRLLADYLAANPDERSPAADHWWFDDLADVPAFRTLIGPG